MDVVTATHPGSGIIVLMARTTMNIGMMLSPGRLGVEMYVEMKIAPATEETAKRLRPTATLLFWKIGNWARKNMRARMTKVVIRTGTSGIPLPLITFYRRKQQSELLPTDKHGGLSSTFTLTCPVVSAATRNAVVPHTATRRKERKRECWSRSQ